MQAITFVVQCCIGFAVASEMQMSAEADYDNAVLVYARNAEQLALAYPNYSTNVRYFLSKVERYLESR